MRIITVLFKYCEDVTSGDIFTALSADVTCFFCSSDDDADHALGHFFQCIWCQKCLHGNCINKFEPVIA